MASPKFSIAAQKNLGCPKFGGAAAPLAPPVRTPMPESFKVGWYPPKKLGRVALNGVETFQY